MIDAIYENVFARGARMAGQLFHNVGDRGLIEGVLIGGSTRLVSWVAAISRVFQSGYIYHYALAMMAGVIVLISFFVLVH